MLYTSFRTQPQNLIGDRAYDSDPLDAELRQEGRRLRRYQRRWIVERFFASMQWQRRLLVRWEYYSVNSLGFVHLAALCILVKQF